MVTLNKNHLSGSHARYVTLLYTLIAGVVSIHSSITVHRFSHWANTLAEYSCPLMSVRTGDNVCVCAGCVCTHWKAPPSWKAHGFTYADTRHVAVGGQACDINLVAILSRWEGADTRCTRGCGWWAVGLQGSDSGIGTQLCLRGTLRIHRVSSGKRCSILYVHPIPMCQPWPQKVPCPSSLQQSALVPGQPKAARIKQQE